MTPSQKTIDELPQKTKQLLKPSYYNVIYQSIACRRMKSATPYRLHYQDLLWIYARQVNHFYIQVIADQLSLLKRIMFAVVSGCNMDSPIVLMAEPKQRATY